MNYQLRTLLIFISASISSQREKGGFGDDSSEGPASAPRQTANRQVINK